MYIDFNNEEESLKFHASLITNDDFSDDTVDNGDLQLFVADLIAAISKKQIVELSIPTIDGNMDYVKGVLSNVSMEYKFSKSGATKISGDIIVAEDIVKHFLFVWGGMTQLNSMSKPGEHMKYYLINGKNDVAVTFVFFQRDLI